MIGIKLSMPYEYSAQNHDWDMTLRAAWNLVMTGQAAKGKNELEFSCLTGGMILSFCAVESFINSIAFVAPSKQEYAHFDYEAYTKIRNFWGRLKAVCSILNIAIDQSQGVFKILEEMRVWRNALVHFSPYSIEPTAIDIPIESKELHTEFRSQEYTKSVTVEKAKEFYGCAFQIIDLIEKTSGLSPRASCTYTTTK
jgi:hypothetical protein